MFTELSEKFRSAIWLKKTPKTKKENCFMDLCLICNLDKSISHFP